MAAAAGPRRVVECGLEVPRGVVYQGWELGGEYTKTLVVKNVQLRTQRIKYTIKGDQFHTAVYPRPIVLSAGMSYTLPIVFKPTKKEPCEESIELETSEGAVEVCLQAVLPSVALALPESLRFGFCAVRDSLSLDFQISNTSNISARFSWDCPKCFTISPDTGELPPKTSRTLSATFAPDSAEVYRGTATCSYGREGAEKVGVVKLGGVGKYPHVVVRLPSSKRGRGAVERQGADGENEGRVEGTGGGGGGGKREVVVEFGSVAVGTGAQRWIELLNVSAVAASVSVVPASHSRLSPAHFSCRQSPHTLPPHSSHRLPLTFCPALPSPHPVFAFFEVGTRGGLATTTVRCTGATKVPRVSIEEKVLDFGNVPCGQSATAVLHIRNDSDMTALFQLQLELGSVFRAESTCAKLPPHSTHTIPVHFVPRRPIPHCRRVACLAQHQEPLFVYFIGTVYSETVKPVVLQPSHVKDYIANAQRGITKLPPEKVREVLGEGRLTADDTTGCLQPASTADNHSLPKPTATGDAPVSPFADYLHSQHDPSGTAHVSVDCEELRFGRVSPHSVSESKSLHVTNHTEGTVVCVWMTESCGTFSVAPAEREIPPGATCLFTAVFRPKVVGKFFFEELECYVFYKSLQNYQSVSGGAAVVTPPWCLSVRAQGHSFTSDTHTFTPNLVFETRDVVFPACGPLEPAYRSLTVWNDGDTPALFELTPDSRQIFTIKPLSGLIPKGQYQTLVMEMVPREAKTYKHITHCALNATSNYTQELLLSGTAELSPVLLENQGQLFFKPTCVGTTSSAGLKVTNTAHLPLRYEWRVNGEGSEVIDVKPRQGTILPSESQTHQWQFSPLETCSLALRAVLLTTTSSSTGGSFLLPRPRQHKVSLDLFGQGLLGQIECSPSSLQFGTVTMDTSHTHTITLHNPTLCTLHYSLDVSGHTSTTAHQQSGAGSTSPPHGVKMDPCGGVLHARASQVVRVTARPVKTAPYSCAISCRLISTNPAVAPTESHKICTLDITGAYPSLAITDVHGLEAANGTSKAKLWQMLSIDRVNGHLKEDPSSSELRYAIATRHSMRRSVSVHTHAVEDFHFGAAPLGSGRSVVHLVLENRARVEARWGFQFPTDMHLEPEYWADSGSLDEVERHHHDVVTNRLFTVSPKTGRLAPGETVSILCSFKHTHIGSSKLPVLLKIHLGREILMNWSGVTVERGVPHMFFTSHHHSFHPLPIGLNSYPIQTYELHNAGEATATYEVDTAPLEALATAHYLVPVLQCLAVQGEVPPRGTASLPFIFSPLEAKRYSVDVPISFSTGESVLVTFSGEGVDPVPPSPATTHSSSLTPAPTGPPPMPLPGQTAGLSTEQLSLGPLPLFCPVRRLLFLSNYHPTHTLSFSWLLTSAQPAAEVVSVDPREGYVAPGRSCACRVTFYSQSSPAVYDLDVICRVVDETEAAEFQWRSGEWARRQEERKQHFTISHPTTTTTDEVRPQTIPRQSMLQPSPFHPGSSSNSDLRGSSYQVLPPIGTHPPDMSYEEWKKQDLSIRSKARPRPTKPSTDQPPSPPTPLLLHLGLAAQTYSLADYSSLFDDLDRFYIAPHTTTTTCWPRGEGTPLRMKTEERDLILSLLSDMARELMDDSNFHAALERLQREPVPYFTQFSSQPHSAQSEAEQQVDREPLEDGSNGGGGGGDATAQSVERERERREFADRGEMAETGGQEGQTVGDDGGSLRARGGDGEKEKDTPTNLTERWPEVECLIESVLESTLLEVARESEAGQFDITAPHFLVAQHTP